jgi:uncharacterized protein YutE (UPF0331/DUF86 family)
MVGERELWYNGDVMKIKNILLIVPANDAEAAMIILLARKIKLPTLVSFQPHGATLDREPGVLKKIKESGAREIVVVEMPGIKIEEKIKKLGVKIKIIDHHRYGDLNRKKMKSSLEQFLQMFKLTDLCLSELGFDPRLVRGIGIQDRGFVDSLRREKYSTEEIKKVFAYQNKLLRPYLNLDEEKKYEAAAREAWKNREEWNGYFIVTGHTKEGFRRHLSHHVFEKTSQALPIILDERGRGVISIQDSPAAAHLFKKFGGFTFGEKGNWGYKNGPGKKKVTLEDVKKELC